MADFMIPNVVKLKLLFEIIGFFYFSFFPKKKIEINWDWECYYKFSFKLSEIKFEYNKLEDKNKFKFSN